MLAKRIIPTILVKGKTAYKGQCFVSDRSIGSAMAIARTHAKRGVDELCILDVSATAEGRGPDLDLIRELSADCYIPITVGGGVKSLQDIDDLLRAGADKVCLCSFALGDLVRRAAERFGRQAIVVSMDVHHGRLWSHCGNTLRGMYLNGVEVGVLGWARYFQDQGAGEILLQSIDRDGTMTGYDLDLIRQVSAAVSIPVIASGGCSGYQDMLDAFKAGADACAAGALFAFTDATPRGAAKFLKENQLEVRL